MVEEIIKQSKILLERIMQAILISKPQIKLVGVSVKTSYKQELDKMESAIFPCVKRYFHEKLADKILHRIKPGTTFCVYTDYESDYKGSYTYFIGEEVLLFDDQLSTEFQTLLIPMQQYAKFTTAPAPMPDVIVNAWNYIWKMSASELGGERQYNVDFEIYDERATDRQNIVLDIYVGIKQLT
jgi:predicted transcriptional regulator YdeE